MEEFGSKASIKMKRASSLHVCTCELVMMNESQMARFYVYFGNAGVALLPVSTACVFWHAGFLHIPK